jgi:hypothetical protein
LENIRKIKGSTNVQTLVAKQSNFKINIGQSSKCFDKMKMFCDFILKVVFSFCVKWSLSCLDGSIEEENYQTHLFFPYSLPSILLRAKI